MVRSLDMLADLSVVLPALDLSIKDENFSVLALLDDEVSRDFSCVIVDERGGIVRVARVSMGERTISLVMTRAYVSTGSSEEIHCPDAVVEGGVLSFGPRSSWKSHPMLAIAHDERYAERVRESWHDLKIWTREPGISEGGESAGLRIPQLGALHALAAHWSTKVGHAKVVLPTGTGKTEVMIAGLLHRRPTRALVLVPTDALRTQLHEKFLSLGILHKLGVLGESALRPVVAKMLKAPVGTEALSLARRSNVVISTVQMLLGLNDVLLVEFLGHFDLVFFDEAHHLPAASWDRISQKIPKESAVVSVTATPFRNDGKRVPGELVYQFPLRLAQEQGYFRPIEVVRVEEYDPDRADRAIAISAIGRARSDEASGYQHTIFARARSIDHAEFLHGIYSEIAGDLHPVLLHSRVSSKETEIRLERLKSQESRVVICVDMLGEGFDLPSLKIAALHDIHKSLPVTLQFIGRFTRAARSVGSASAVINMAERMSDTAVASLFADDADWNELVPDLSAQAVRSEYDMDEFVASMRSTTVPEDVKFDLALLRPNLAVTMYRATNFRPALIRKALPPSTIIHQIWISDDQSLLVFIAQDRTFPDWSVSRGATGLEWNLGIIAYDPDTRTLYTNTTYSASRNSLIARKVGGESATCMNGEQVFRVFDGLHRAVLHNVGLHRRGGGLKFQMLAGIDIGEYVTNAIQSGSAKSNLLAIGYDDGRKASLGASAKGRVWAMSSCSVPDWLAWSRRVAAKVQNIAIPTDTFLRFALVPKDITSLPGARIFTCLPPNELLPGWYEGVVRVMVEGASMSFDQSAVSFDLLSVEGNVARVGVTVGSVAAEVSLAWGNEGFVVDQVQGPLLKVQEGRDEVTLGEFLAAHPPALLLVDGSEVVGRQHFYRPMPHPYTFDQQSILALDWEDTNIRLESKWRSGELRENSIQGFMIDRCLEGSFDFVFDDDDSGELADIIAIEDRLDEKELVVTLYHCKFASGNDPGARVKDLYEVCGQAVKSSRILNQPAAIAAHIVAREQRRSGRSTRFEKGDMAALRILERRLSQYRLRLNICVVQPGLSANALTADLSSILSAADGFILEFTGRRLRVFGSS